MLLQKTFSFQSYTNWAHEINLAAKDFFKTFGFYPNIMLANPITYSHINFEANKSKGNTPTAENPEVKDYEGMLGFKTEEYSIEFFIDEKLPEKVFNHLYDMKA